MERSAIMCRAARCSLQAATEASSLVTGGAGGTSRGARRVSAAGSGGPRRQSSRWLRTTTPA
eukprot:1548201-Prymnesium_polylepis.1